MDLAYIFQVVIAFLVIVLVVMFLLWTEIRWHARQRQELMHLLIYSLCRLSKKQIAARAEEMRRAEAQFAGRRFAPGAEDLERMYEEEAAEVDAEEAATRASRV